MCENIGEKATTVKEELIKTAIKLAAAVITTTTTITKANTAKKVETLVCNKNTNNNNNNADNDNRVNALSLFDQLKNSVSHHLTVAVSIADRLTTPTTIPTTTISNNNNNKILSHNKINNNKKLVQQSQSVEYNFAKMQQIEQKQQQQQLSNIIRKHYNINSDKRNNKKIIDQYNVDADIEEEYDDDNDNENVAIPIEYADEKEADDDHDSIDDDNDEEQLNMKLKGQQNLITATNKMLLPLTYDNREEIKQTNLDDECNDLNSSSSLTSSSISATTAPLQIALDSNTSNSNHSSNSELIEQQQFIYITPNATTTPTLTENFLNKEDTTKNNDMKKFVFSLHNQQQNNNNNNINKCYCSNSNYVNCCCNNDEKQENLLENKTTIACQTMLPLSFFSKSSSLSTTTTTTTATTTTKTTTTTLTNKMPSEITTQNTSPTKFFSSSATTYNFATDVGDCGDNKKTAVNTMNTSYIKTELLLQKQQQQNVTTLPSLLLPTSQISPLLGIVHGTKRANTTKIMPTATTTTKYGRIESSSNSLRQQQINSGSTSFTPTSCITASPALLLLSSSASELAATTNTNTTTTTMSANSYRKSIKNSTNDITVYATKIQKQQQHEQQYQMTNNTPANVQRHHLQYQHKILGSGDNIKIKTSNKKTILDFGGIVKQQHEDNNGIMRNDNKRKRCNDHRYDSSESSDSGVAVSLSCTDSSAGSSEDASEPGSPCTDMQTFLGEDATIKIKTAKSSLVKKLEMQQQQQQHYHKYNKKPPVQSVENISCIKMRIPAQNILGENTQKGTTSSSTTNTTNLNTIATTSGIKMQVNAINANSNNCAYNKNNTNCKFINKQNTAIKSIQQQQQKVNNNNNNTTKGRQTLPTLQWPWNNASSGVTISMAKTKNNNNKNLTTATNTCIQQQHQQQNRKRNLTISHATTNSGGGGVRAADNGAKKSRCNITNTTEYVTNNLGTINSNLNNNFNINCSKRLKAAALEESQTKITGYFKSQMKAQNANMNDKVQQNNNINNMKNDQQLTTSAEPTTTATTSNQLTISTSTAATTTAASLNNFFNIITQLKENNSQQQQNSDFDEENNLNTTTTTLISPIAINNNNNNNNNNTKTIPVPALKKIERSKPTKIAQVAPNLRKMPINNNNLTTQTNNNNNNNNVNNNKSSPPKKHVAIAPRTPEMKQQQLQQQAAAFKNIGVNNATTTTTTTATLGTATTTTAATNSILTGMRQLPSISTPTAAAIINVGQQQLKQHQQNQQQQQSINNNNNKLQTSNNNTTTALSTTIPVPVPIAQATATPTFYQLPAMQLPNLLHLPQLLATTNGTSIMQINNIAAAAAAAAKVTQAAATSATTAAQAAQAAQYLFNGPVFKLHQITAAAATTNSFNMMNATDLQDLWLKQQQQQQQMQPQPKINDASNNNNNNGASFQEVFQQQIMAALANQQQQQQVQQVQQQQQLQRLGGTSLQQQQPVFMATPAGLLFNAASLPAMLAQAAAALAVNNGSAQQQPQQQQRQQQIKQQPLPALQPIQQTNTMPTTTIASTTTQTLPALSSIFAPNSAQHDVNEIQQVPQQQFQQQQQQQFAQQLVMTQQHQQYMSSTQPPPLSAVSLGNNNNNINMPLNSNTNQFNKTAINNQNMPLTVVNNNLTNLATAAVTVATPQTVHVTAPKLAIVKATQNCQYAGLNSQPPPLVTISNIKPRPLAITTTTATTGTTLSTANIVGTIQQTQQQKPSMMSKPYQKRTVVTNNNNKSLSTTNGKIVATPTTPPPLVSTVTSHKLAIAATPPLVSLVTTATTTTSPTTTNATETTDINSDVSKPTLVALSSSNIAASITTAVPIVAATPAALPNLLPVSSSSCKNNSDSKFATTPATSTPLHNVDLFDFVKNSKGAISITLANNNNNGNAVTKTITTPNTIANPLENNVTANKQLTAAAFSLQNNKNCLNTIDENVNFNDEKRKRQKLDNDNDDEEEEEEDGVCEAYNNNENYNDNDEQMSAVSFKLELNNDCSLSGYSSHSVSSAADLSLEGSTQASSNVSSPRPACQEDQTMASQEENTMPSQEDNNNISVTTIIAVPSPSDSNFSSSHNNSSSIMSGGGGGASNQDIFSELATSSCISISESMSASNLTSSSKTNCCNAVDDLESDTVDEPLPVKRNLSTPESGIGGSLSNSESNISSVSSMSSTLVQCSSIAGNLSSDLSISSPPTPLAVNNNSMTASESMSVTSSNVPSPISPADTCNDITMTNSSSNDGTTSLSSSSLSLSSTTSIAVANAIANNNSCLSLFNTSAFSSGNSSTYSFANITGMTATTPTTIETTFLDDSNFTTNSSSQQKSAISPILSQPKTIRFPASRHHHGAKGSKRHHDGVCYWHQCNKKHDSNSKLLDHMQSHHVNSQNGPFACLWVGCKVYNKESCSRRWLERHVLSHGGSKQFKCIVEGCGLRFGSQLALQKHVNNHFSATENKESNNKRTSDPPVPKQLRKNGKKLRYRRQPFSARMFDFFDTGIMEGLQHRLRQISCLTSVCNSMTFYGKCIMRRKTNSGNRECFVHWSPQEIISDEWLPDSDEPFVKTIDIKSMKSAEKIRLENILRSAYKMPYSRNLLERITQCSNQNEHINKNILKTTTITKTMMQKGINSSNNNNVAADEESDNEYNDNNSNINNEEEEDEDEEEDDDNEEATDNDNEEEEEDDDTETDADTCKTSNNSTQNSSESRSSLMQKMLSLSTFTYVLPQHKKHSRKPLKRITL